MSKKPFVTIRPAKLFDAEAIANIYNEAILTTTATFDTKTKSITDREAWLKSHDDRHPVLVAVVNGEVAGWACLTSWSSRHAYDETAETSLYVFARHQGRGIGRKLNNAIIAEAARLKYHTLIARISQESQASVHLNQQAGFVHIGTMKQVGRKFGKLLDVHIMQKMME